MTLREARPADIPAMHALRLRARENRLSDPSVVTEKDYHDFMARRTASWVCEANGVIMGFAMVDVEKKNLWALFVAPEHEFNGVGRSLHDVMIAWYFTQADVLRLGTAPDTRAEAFYRKAGYSPMGKAANGELVFELRRPPVAH